MIGSKLKLAQSWVNINNSYIVYMLETSIATQGTSISQQFMLPTESSDNLCKILGEKQFLHFLKPIAKPK